MVLKLNIPDLVEDELAFVDEIVSERTQEPNKTYFTDFRTKWKDRVTEYETNRGDPELINESTEIDSKNKFINLYGTKVDTMYQKLIIDQLRERTLQICPACGEDGTPNTLDHYLPKDLYPEFSILSKNLFPMCDICQGKKSTKVLSPARKRIFLHPYYDDFLNNQVINLCIEKPFNAPEGFSLKVAEGIDVQSRNVVMRHIKEIEFTGRYSKFFKDEYFRLLRVVKMMRDNDHNIEQQIDSFMAMAKDKSINSWGHILYSGVRSNPELMDYLKNGDLSPHL
ncbi:hypothetical protein OW495_16560 [Vibrio sp. 14N.309.X.WAT.E.F5]|uniref:hypothetical protein n=1 Tax=Vibrio sp. 14N.309.X.WAT.E.F5 TaxID=2998321 RepID=UPI0025AFC3CE|nr:hypothetical protein [Vibrio sp. 14N.309.X.WAT.E.F5]MDN2668338.1 hypothetical protein [Vibrio sp. 14N.309.X.WAT.E.F5]